LPFLYYFNCADWILIADAEEIQQKGHNPRWLSPAGFASGDAKRNRLKPHVVI
jgi:hypothetical protein